MTALQNRGAASSRAGAELHPAAAALSKVWRKFLASPLITINCCWGGFTHPGFSREHGAPFRQRLWVWIPSEPKQNPKGSKFSTKEKCQRLCLPNAVFMFTYFALLQFFFFWNAACLACSACEREGVKLFGKWRCRTEDSGTASPMRGARGACCLLAVGSVFTAKGQGDVRGQKTLPPHLSWKSK